MEALHKGHGSYAEKTEMSKSAYRYMMKGWLKLREYVKLAFSPIYFFIREQIFEISALNLENSNRS